MYLPHYLLRTERAYSCSKPVFFCLAIAMAGCGTIEKAADGYANKVLDGQQSLDEAPKDQEFFDSLFIVDLHADTLLFSRGLAGDTWFGKPLGHVDAKRLAEGNVAVQVLSTVSKYPLARDRSIGGLLRTCHDENDPDLITMLSLLQQQFHDPADPTTLQRRIEIQRQRFENHHEGMMLIDSADEFEAFAKAWQDGPKTPVGAILAIEGLHFYQGREATLRKLWDQGFRMASLTHHFDNVLAGSSTGCMREGPTEVGKKALKEMGAMGWTLDLAHASDETIMKTIAEGRVAPDEVYPTPPLVSHTGFQGQCVGGSGVSTKECEKYDERNIKKKAALEVAKRGGTIGMIYWSRQHNADRHTPAEVVIGKIVRTIARLDTWLSRHTKSGDLCDSKAGCLAWPASHYISLGSDWDGAVDTPFDATGLIALIVALRDEKCREDESACLNRNHSKNRRFSDDDIRHIAGWNACRVLMQSLPAGRTEEQASAFCRGLVRR